MATPVQGICLIKKKKKKKNNTKIKLPVRAC